MPAGDCAHACEVIASRDIKHARAYAKWDASVRILSTHAIRQRMYRSMVGDEGDSLSLKTETPRQIKNQQNGYLSFRSTFDSDGP